METPYMVTTLKKSFFSRSMVYVESWMWVLNDDPRLTSSTLRQGRFWFLTIKKHDYLATVGAKSQYTHLIWLILKDNA